MFKPVSAKPNFVELEHRILDFWRENKVLEKYLRRNNSSQEKFSFLDGPITANNPMGVHHAWGRTLKDFYQRYKNMQGFKQRFQNGFDNQGLWVEVEVEKKLGFKSKKDIEKLGIARFVEKCKEHTLKFARVQTEQSKRLGYFMDWGNDYYTMSDENNYAIWHFLKKVWRDKNLYKGRDSVPWCPRCGTAISQHEILTEEYKELTHDAVYLKYWLTSSPKKGQTHFEVEKTAFLVWTTTPWTIPGNVSLAVNPEITYVEMIISSRKGVRPEKESLILAKSRLSEVDEPYEIVREFLGSELEGLKYEGPFDNLRRVREAREENPDTFHSVVLSKELVSEEEGTGIVHTAPGAGTEDFRLGQEVNLPVIEVIDEAANYLDGFGEFSGKNAKEHPELILDYLKGQKDRSFVYKIKPYIHRYPVCWRCHTELVWRVVDEWYIAMDDKRHGGAKNYRQRLQEVIKDVRWIPSFGYDRELDWLRNMDDWLISKKRYWGLALPIWECACGHFEVIGSKEELKEKAVEGWQDFEGNTPHRPWIDAVRIKCSECGKLMNRIPDVGNPWLDAGIVSFSTLKYFEDKDYWQEWFPADLVLESLPGQFKNWFYSLLAMSVVLEDRTPFRTLFGYALVKDEHGEEMHKSKGNAIWFDGAAEKMGVDVMRWLYLTHEPLRDLWFGYKLADEIRRRFFLILWNCYKFFITYAELDGFDPRGERSQRFQGPTPHLSGSILDRWILSRLNRLVKDVTSHLEDYKNQQAARAIEDFVTRDLSTWYIRRIRSRVGPTVPDGDDKKIVHEVLYEVLLTLAKVLSPFIPFMAEEMYQNLSGEKASVHLADWPKSDESLMNSELEENVSLVREICEKGHSNRREAGIKVRQPLMKLKVKGQKAKVQLESQKWGNFFTDLIKDELNIRNIEFDEGKEIEVELDIEITPELKLEGLARETIRNIQNARKEASCNLNDRVTATFPDNEENRKAVQKFGDYIKRETLSVELEPGQGFMVKVSK